METLIDLFELNEPVVETYRDSYRACVVTPLEYRLEYRCESRESIDCSIDLEDPTRRFPTPSSHVTHVSERRSRARLWGTED